MAQLVAMILCSMCALGGVGSARAHAIVVKSSPAGHAPVLAGPVEIRITFNTRLDHARSRLTLAAPDGSVAVVALRDHAAPTLLSGQAQVTVPGEWKLRWQVLAADGHITRGEIPFRVRATP